MLPTVVIMAKIWIIPMIRPAKKNWWTSIGNTMPIRRETASLLVGLGNEDLHVEGPMLWQLCTLQHPTEVSILCFRAGGKGRGTRGINLEKTKTGVAIILFAQSNEI